MKKLENLAWSPKWVSHLGAVQGCLEYLDIEISDAWLYGGTGHAFLINIHEEVCPSGPTAWATMMLFEGGKNLGYDFDGVFAWKHEPIDFAHFQEQAWEFTKNAIDDGFPLYGWELDTPEFYVIYGYDQIGYYYSGPGASGNIDPKPWNELGDTDIGLIEIYSIKPGEPQTDQVVVRSALENALKHASNPKDWIYEKYASGLKGYDFWISALESGQANRFGMCYNAAVWHECRALGVEFLEEARTRLVGRAGKAFTEGIEQYQVVADRLKKVSESFPWTPEDNETTLPLDEQCQETIIWLKEARKAEAAGLDALEEIVAALS
ncbi:MAG: hypothetical protein MAG431_02562 [Chloroflexi bacterium]|nr:hypothetical protein [Chloroflexota bacterium]